VKWTDPITKKEYYKIPFQHKEKIDENIQDLGFAFYTFLNVPYWLENLDIDVDVSSNSSFFEEFIIEGPPNTEIVYMNGALQLTRRAFFLSDKTPWEGAVHLHAKDINPVSEPGLHYKYAGDGSVNPNVPTGWMTGEAHSTKEAQHKLLLKVVANNKIILPDFSEDLDFGFVLNGDDVQQNLGDLMNLGDAVDYSVEDEGLVADNGSGASNDGDGSGAGIPGAGEDIYNI